MLEQDKWLSLARFGMALMSSQAPTFGQALGEGLPAQIWGFLRRGSQIVLAASVMASAVSRSNSGPSARLGRSGAKKPGRGTDAIRSEGSKTTEGKDRSNSDCRRGSQAATTRPLRSCTNSYVPASMISSSLSTPRPRIAWVQARKRS